MPLAISVKSVSKRYTISQQAHQNDAGVPGLLERVKRGIQPAMRREAFWALQDVSFDVRKGEVVGIIGKNGAGKSTLLKILSRITEPTRGEIDVFGRVGSLLEVGTGFHPELTGRENVFLNGAILGMARQEIQKRFDEIVEFSGVEHFLDTPVKRYSSGMYVRLAFAVAAHLNSDILVIDEVLAVGDAEFQKKCLGKMHDVAVEGRTVLFVSHNMSVIQQLCDRAVHMQSGRVVADGLTKDVVAGYYGDAVTSENGQFELAEHSSRAGEHDSIIKRVTLFDDAGDPRSVFFPESSVIVEMELVLPEPISEPRLAVAVEDVYGRRIFSVASYFSTQRFPALNGHCVVRCTIDRLNLGAGRFLMSFSIGDKYHGLIDALNCSVAFEVEWHNNYGNGEPYGPVYGPVLSESRWALIGPDVESSDRVPAGSING